MYAEGGVAAYWVVDPEVPSVRAFRLVDGEHVDTGYAEGDEVLRLDEPLAVRMVPADLLDL